MTPSKKLEDMSLTDVVDFLTGFVVISIGRGDLRSAIETCVTFTTIWQKAAQKKLSKKSRRAS